MKALLISAVIAASVSATVHPGFAKCVPLIKEAREQMVSARLSKRDQEQVKALLEEADRLSEANDHKGGIRKANEALSIINKK
jgi:hypothetical protein